MFFVCSSKIGGSADISSSTGPVDVDIGIFYQGLTGIFRLHAESVGACEMKSELVIL